MKVVQLCLILSEPMHYIVHGILQARILEWIAFPLPRGSSQPRDWKWVSCIAGGFFTSWATGEAQEHWSGSLFLLQWIFKTKELNWGLLHCRQILYQLTCQGSPSWYYFYLKDHWIIFQNIFPNFYFFNYESITTHLKETWKIQNKITASSAIYYNYFFQ